MSRVIHFEIHVDDPDRASKFYSEVFGWKFQRWEGGWDYWLVEPGDASQPGINGGMMKRRDPAGAVYNTICSDSIDKSIDDIKKAGGTIVLPKMSVPGVGWLTYFKDTEGNIFGVMQEDRNAK